MHVPRDNVLCVIMRVPTERDNLSTLNAFNCVYLHHLLCHWLLCPCYSGVYNNAITHMYVHMYSISPPCSVCVCVCSRVCV